MFWVELALVLLIILVSVRVGGTFMAMAGGVGMLIMTFVLNVAPADPPITVILIMLAVITAAGTMQACGGLDYLVRIAEHILRRNPKLVTILAPVVTYIFTFMCGTGHIIYSLLPVINEIAISNGIRPERPISASVVSSQQAITACPISAATLAIVAFLSESQQYASISIAEILLVCVPATLLGALASAGSVIRKGRELADDPEFQHRLAAGDIPDFSKRDVGEDMEASPAAKKSVYIFLACMLSIVLLGACKALVPIFDNGKALPLVTVIQMFMLVAAAAMVLVTRIDSNKLLDQPVFRSGSFAILLAFGLVWMVNTFINDQAAFITENMAALTNQYPWLYILAVFLIGAITTSQASTTMIMVPIGIALGLPAPVLIAGWLAASSNYFIPCASQCVAAIGFDSAGTTTIGKFVFNHSYMLPGLVCTVVSVVTGLLLGALVL